MSSGYQEICIWLVQELDYVWINRDFLILYHLLGVAGWPLPSINSE